MSKNVLFIGWNNTRQGREKLGLELFQEWQGLIEKAMGEGTIDSHETIMLDQHGGDLNGFTILRGDAEKLFAFSRTPEMVDIQLRANLINENMGFIHGWTGEGTKERFMKWAELVGKLG